MMKKFLVLLFALCFSVNAMALTRASHWILSPGVGCLNFSNARGLEKQKLPNLGLGYGINNLWSVELLLGGIKTKQKNNNESVSGALYDINLLYHPESYSPLRPYWLIGIGAMNISQHFPKDTNTQKHISFGFGMSFSFSEWIAIRAGARDFYTKNGHKHDILWNFGVSFVLGGK